MKIQLIAVGTKMPDWVQKGFGEYAKRLPKEMAVSLIELSPGHRAKNAPVQQAMEAEAKAILQHLDPQTFVVALDVLGKSWSTEQLAEKLECWRMDGVNLAFIIGGPDGLTKNVLDRANAKWSLSKLTMPHPLVRVVWVEQFYRAWTLINGHPYHKS